MTQSHGLDLVALYSTLQVSTDRALFPLFLDTHRTYSPVGLPLVPVGVGNIIVVHPAQLSTAQLL